MAREKGFTLVELLVVLAILAILVAIVVPSLVEEYPQSVFPTITISQKDWAESWGKEKLIGNQYSIDVPSGNLEVRFDFPEEVDDYTVTWSRAELSGVAIGAGEEGYRLIVPSYPTGTLVATVKLIIRRSRGYATDEYSINIRVR